MRLLPSATLSPLPLLVLWSLSCASANLDEGTSDAKTVDAGLFIPPDARKSSVDARTPPDMVDAAIPVDAAIIVPDAETGNLFCNDHDECSSGKCCAPLLNVCVDGTVAIGICFPD